jgi:hypothetical protein
LDLIGFATQIEKQSPGLTSQVIVDESILVDLFNTLIATDHGFTSN